MWDPGQYARFQDDRSRPFFDLVGRIDIESPASIVDLGCGPGTLTRTLLDRWPRSRVVGIDSSSEMLAAAVPLAVPDRLEFEQARIEDWRPDYPLDIIVANASLQWVPRHLDVVLSLADYLAPGGVLAFQVPAYFDSVSHRIIREVSTSERWLRLVGDIDRLEVLRAAGYAEQLMDRALSTDAWETTYIHVLQGRDAVLEWFKGTALRPGLSRLAGDEQQEFLEEVGARFRHSFPAGRHGTLFPFTRIFVVARKR